MNALNTLLEAMASSGWIVWAVFMWVGLVWFPILDRLATWLDQKRGICTQCDRLRIAYVDETMRFLDFCDQIGLTPDEVAKRGMAVYTFWAKTEHDIQHHELTHHLRRPLRTP